MTNFKTHHTLLPYGHHKCMVPYMFAVIWIFFCFRKNYHPVVWTKHSSKYCLKTLTNHKIVDRHSKWIALLMVYFGNLWDRIALMLTQVHGSYIYWYTRKTLGTKLLTIENYIFLLMFLWFSVAFFTVNNEHIRKCFS